MTRAPVFVVAATFLLSATPALAGAWPQEEGTGQIIVTAVYSNSTKGFDADGKTVNIDDYQKAEVYALVEYGITGDVTVIFNPSFRDVSIEGPGAEASGLGYTEIGARYRLAEGNGWVPSLQGTLRIPGQEIDTNLAQIGATDTEYDMRALVGYGFKIGEADAFVDLQGAYRLRDGDPPNEFRADLTFGLRPTQKMQVLAQLFNTFSDGSGQGVFSEYRFHNAQFSVVYDVNESFSVQVGGLATLGGENALRERGIVAAAWFRF